MAVDYMKRTKQEDCLKGKNAATGNTFERTHRFQDLPIPGANPDDRDKLCVQNVRKAHGLWGKTKREWSGTLARSKGCANTKGCKFEADIEKAVQDGDAIDARIMTIEKNFSHRHTAPWQGDGRHEKCPWNSDSQTMLRLCSPCVVSPLHFSGSPFLL